MLDFGYRLGLFDLNDTNLLVSKCTQAISIPIYSQKKVELMLFYFESSLYAVAKLLKI